LIRGQRSERRRMHVGHPRRQRWVLVIWLPRRLRDSGGWPGRIAAAARAI
jgi:hypothetical protein